MLPPEPILGGAGRRAGLDDTVDAREVGQDAVKWPDPAHVRQRPALYRCSLVGSVGGLVLGGPFSTVAFLGWVGERCC